MKARTHTGRDEAAQMVQYLRLQTNERPIVRDFEKGYAIQRCVSGCYWDFDANRWDNGCAIGERSEFETRHGMVDYL